MNKRNRLSNPVANKALKVAQFANTKRRQSKGEKLLERRLADFSLMMNTRNPAGGVQQRKESGGFHRPGSNQR